MALVQKIVSPIQRRRPFQSVGTDTRISHTAPETFYGAGTDGLTSHSAPEAFHGAGRDALISYSAPGTFYGAGTDALKTHSAQETFHGAGTDKDLKKKMCNVQGGGYCPLRFVCCFASSSEFNSSPLFYCHLER